MNSFRSVRAFGAAVIGVGLLASLTPAISSAETYPARSIKIIVPFPAGGGPDMIAREVATTVTSQQGWTIIIDNKPGSGGNIGMDAAAKAAPDGYTLVMGQTSNMAINPSLYAKLPYNPQKDLAPVGLVASAPLVIAVASNSPYKTLSDLLNAAKANPEGINYASSGSGTVAHLATEQLQRIANVKLTHVPYKGAAQGATDLIGGQIQMYISSVVTLSGHIKNGKMRALAVTSAKRSADLPNVPTVAESGFKGFEAVTWFGLAAPAGVSKDKLSKLNAAFNRALENPDVRKRLTEQGADVLGGTPEQFASLVRDETGRWAKVVKESGAKAN
ncbi:MULTISPECIES: Bug family tripartite tricarboxylate transporter substrate binding protein [Comamonas]|uniref:Bug family tripartite tricarboxylate transporter substrate binding protein n=1 Tax=Comamonas TaxID=283 RepID=UPI00050EED47|nr:MULTISPECIES: tripartite tricarboxylate transporter substrate binding protein [Comamonas]KGG87717.1 LacI family transcriptional regulator [Comamonas thiooxydans]KGG96538.1 LacI family transcriptional regulator [Comamonas thiooxydans]KGG99115.1 LacI family transcriptional regulator [Comamonas thiooxydans]KGH08272.1 LacI family transcriptional regulator [Comamonas thiooxydans]TZG06258.1 tripartite tricarboxylate transporter substrate binding protein [Comamonas thiooxydans]